MNGLEGRRYGMGRDFQTDKPITYGKYLISASSYLGVYKTWLIRKF
jgi:hypothetical protein